jgi:predicted dinucleotide-binding enzyme
MLFGNLSFGLPKEGVSTTEVIQQLLRNVKVVKNFGFGRK